MTVIRKKGNINLQSIKTFSYLTLNNRQENSHLINLDYLWHSQKFEVTMNGLRVYFTNQYTMGIREVHTVNINRN